MYSEDKIPNKLVPNKKKVLNSSDPESSKEEQELIFRDYQRVMPNGPLPATSFLKLKLRPSPFEVIWSRREGAQRTAVKEARIKTARRSNMS